MKVKCDDNKNKRYIYMYITWNKIFVSEPLAG